MPIYMKNNNRSQLTYAERHAFTPENPVVSWSSYSCFKRDPEEWYDVYVLGYSRTSPELEFGKRVADSMETDKPMAPFTRLAIVEYEFDTKLGTIPLIGSADTFAPPARTKKRCKGGEFKTGRLAWDQKRVDEHGQLTFYSLLLWLQDLIMPEDIEWFLEWAPTQKEENGDFRHVITFVPGVPIKKFYTVRTMKQCLKLASDIKQTHWEMMQYYKERKIKELSK